MDQKIVENILKKIIQIIQKPFKNHPKISYLRLRRDTRWNIRQNMATALVHYRFLNIIHSMNQDSKLAFGDQAFQSLQTALENWFKPVDSSFDSGLYQTTQITKAKLKAFLFNIPTFEVSQLMSHLLYLYHEIETLF